VAHQPRVCSPFHCTQSVVCRGSCILPCIRSQQRFPRESKIEFESTKESPLTPELKDFINRIIVPILVDKYIALSRNCPTEDDGVVQ
jgi:hypothetical protein